MASIDPKVAQVLDRKRGGDSDDEDALIAELEEEDEETAVSGMRERRLEQLHSEMSRAKAMRNTEHGSYTEIKDEKELMEITTSTKLCVVHFMKPDFNRCRIMDEKLGALAGKHFDTRFVSVNVENSPWLVVKLGIKVLPCVISFIEGQGVDRIVGFEGIGYKPDDFTVGELERRLLSSGALVRTKMNRNADERTVRMVPVAKNEAEDDDDWD